MKVVVVGEDGLIARSVVSRLDEKGQQAVVVRPSSSDELMGEFTGARVVIDVVDSPSYDDREAWEFLSCATNELITAARRASISHLVALSMVGTGRLLASSYFRAKAMREQLVAEAGIPYSVLRGTPCYESLGQIADWATDGDTVRIAPVLTQPIAAEDLGHALAVMAVSAPVGGIRDAAGPHRYSLDQLVRAHLRAHHDTRRVRAEPQARFLGAKLDDYVLLPNREAAVYPTTFSDWLVRSLPAMAR
jgi:uncharacterized protein YbjT (DUF2867 family)